MRGPVEDPGVGYVAVQEVFDAALGGGGGGEAVGGKAVLELGDDETGVGVDVAGDGEEGDAAVVYS